MASMDAAERRRLIQAIYALRTGLTNDLTEARLADPQSWNRFTPQLGQRIDGLSPAAVIRMGYDVRLRLLDERVNLAPERMRQGDAERRPHEARLAAVRVENARYYQSDNVFREMAFSFRMTNGTDQPIRRVRFGGIVTSRGRTLVEDVISYDLEEPLAPGESRDFDLVTSFGAFADRAFAREPDLRLALTVVNLGGAGPSDYLFQPYYAEWPEQLRRQVAADRALRDRLRSERDTL